MELGSVSYTRAKQSKYRFIYRLRLHENIKAYANFDKGHSTRGTNGSFHSSFVSSFFTHFCFHDPMKRRKVV